MCSRPGSAYFADHTTSTKFQTLKLRKIIFLLHDPWNEYASYVESWNLLTWSSDFTQNMVFLQTTVFLWFNSLTHLSQCCSQSRYLPRPRVVPVWFKNLEDSSKSLWCLWKASNLNYNNYILKIFQNIAKQQHTQIVIYWKPLQCSFREGNGTPLQYSCLENRMDGGAW